MYVYLIICLYHSLITNILMQSSRLVWDRNWSHEDSLALSRHLCVSVDPSLIVDSECECMCGIFLKNQRDADRNLLCDPFHLLDCHKVPSGDCDNGSERLQAYQKSTTGKKKPHPLSLSLTTTTTTIVEPSKGRISLNERSLLLPGFRKIFFFWRGTYRPAVVICISIYQPTERNSKCGG